MSPEPAVDPMVRVKALERDLDELREEYKKTESMLNGLLQRGLKDMLVQHGAQEFGGGNLRLDASGIQIQTNNNTAATPSLRTFKEFVELANADTTYPVVAIRDAVYSSATRDIARKLIQVTPQSNANTAITVTQTAEVAFADGWAYDTYWQAEVVGFGSATVQLKVESGAGGNSRWVKIVGAPLWLFSMSADPSAGSIADGMIWYRAASELFYGRANGVTQTFAYLSSVINNSLLTTKGDLITRTTTIPVRLGVGADATVLTADSTTTEGIKWAAIVTGALTVTLKTTTYTAVASDFVLGSNSFTVTLPAAASNGSKSIGIGNRGTGIITVARTGADVINGAAINTFILPGEQYVFIADATNNDWRPY